MTFDDLFRLSPGPEERALNRRAPPAPPTDEPRLFGGLLIGQAIVAASSGTKACHSLHALFIGVGKKEKHFDISVEATRDGRSFATRRLEIMQDGTLLLAAYTSHHDGDNGPNHQVSIPELPPPELLEDQRVVRTRISVARGETPRRYLVEDMLDVRRVEIPIEPHGGQGPVRAIWMRPRKPIAGAQVTHKAAIGFASDMGLVHAGLITHIRSGGGRLQAASLDHSIWFHRDATANDWMLHVHHAPTLAHGRGLARAEVFSRDGVLIASVSQEILARDIRH